MSLRPGQVPAGRRVGIVGGGVAGLMAAWELSRLGFEVDLFEASESLGGLASSFDFDGIRIERFYHFICGQDRTLIETVDRLGLRSHLNWRQTRTSFFHDGVLYPFGTSLDLLRFRPLTLADKVRFGWNILYSRQFTRWPNLEDRGAREWLIERLGPRGYSVIWDPLLRVKFGRHHEEISAAWMWHRIHRVAASRKSLFHKERFGYLDGGSDTLVQALKSGAEAAGARIHLRSRVEKLWVENGRCRGLLLETEGGGVEPAEFKHTVCAVPLPVYSRLIPDQPAPYVETVRSVDFIGVVCLILRLRRQVTPNFWLNVHDRRISFNGIIEYSNLTGTERYNGRSIVYVPFYLEQTRPRYGFPDEKLLEEYTEALRVINPEFSRDWIEGYRVFRAPHAQPICTTNFSRKMPPLETPWDGCYLVESTQLYPADRLISGMLRLAQDAVLRILDREEAARGSGIRRRGPREIPA